MRIATLAAWGIAGVLAVASFGAPRVARADDAVTDEARRHFRAGVAYMQDPDGEKVEEAYREFKEAYALSKSPKILGNMGICAMKLERDGEAIDAYSGYLRDVQDIDAGEREQILRDLQTLTVGVVRVRLTVDQPDAQIVDARVPNRGERVTNIYAGPSGPAASAAAAAAEIGMRPGHHEVTVKLAGFEPQTWEFEARAGGHEQHAFSLKKAVVATSRPFAPLSGAEASHGSVVPWVVAGVGGAMLVGGVVTGSLALSKMKDIENRCPNDTCAVGYDVTSDRTSLKTMSTVTDVLLIGGGVLAVGGVTWALLAGGGGERAAASRSPSKPVFSAMCTGAGCAGALRLRF